MQLHSHTPHSTGQRGRISSLSTCLSNSLQLAITQTLEGLYVFHCLLFIMPPEKEGWRFLSPLLNKASKYLRTLFPATTQEQVYKNKGSVETDLSQNWRINSFFVPKVVNFKNNTLGQDTCKKIIAFNSIQDKALQLSIITQEPQRAQCNWDDNRGMTMTSLCPKDSISHGHS